MILTLPALPVAQSAPVAKASVQYQLTAAKAIATYELTPWRKLHPKADLSVTFADPAVTPAQANLIRVRLGYKNPTPVLDAYVLTMVFDLAERPAPRRLAMDAYVFQGSFPKGFRARYLIRTDGKEPRVLTRIVLQNYDLTPPKKPDTTNV